MTTRIATAISNLFDPIPTTLLIGLIGIFATPMNQSDRWLWLGSIVALSLIVALLLRWFMQRGYVFDARLSHGDDLHKDRLGILWIADGILVLVVVMAWLSGPLEPLWSILVAMAAVLVVATLITTRYKVSLHMVGVVSLVTILFTQSRRAGAIALVFIPLVAWSRRVLHRHTTGQLLTGTLISAALIITTFWLTGQLEGS